MGSFVRERREAILMLSAAGAAFAFGCGGSSPTSPTSTSTTGTGTTTTGGNEQRDVLGLAQRDPRAVSVAAGPDPQRHP